jgi:UDP-3-O-acyl-N-acetylglucosamine deacetylase
MIAMTDKEVLEPKKEETRIRATVSKEVVIEGVDQTSLTSLVIKEAAKAIATIRPAESGTGIVFRFLEGYNRFTDENRFLKIPLNISNLKGFKDVFGERYAVLEENIAQVHVVEHLLSAMHIAGITDAEIFIENYSQGRNVVVPTKGAGVSYYFELLNANKTRLEGYVNTVKVVKEDEYTSKKQTNFKTSIKVFPSDNLEILVTSSKQADIFDLKEQPLHVKDVYSEIREHLDARPLGRVAFYPVYLLWKLARARGYQGITEENYIIVTPYDNTETVAAKMQPKYREGKNEYLAHTVLDFLGELFALSPRIKGRFVLENTNHLSRISALKYFVKNSTFSPT